MIWFIMKDCLEFMICNVNWKDMNGFFVLNFNM